MTAAEKQYQVKLDEEKHRAIVKQRDEILRNAGAKWPE